MANVKGSAFASRIKWVWLEKGKPGVDALCAELSAELAALVVDGASMSQWYPFAWFVELNLALDRMFGSGDLGLIEKLGRHGADANLTTVYRLFMRVGTVKWILARAARLWTMHYDSGRLLIRELPGREVELEIQDFATPHRAHCLAVQGWAARASELSGAANVELQEVDCRASGDDRCRFRITWQ